jgi:hypothetical protein
MARNHRMPSDQLQDIAPHLPASDLTEIIANLSTRHGQSHSTTEMTQPHPLLLKFKNPAAPAVQREAEEDWGKSQ